MDFLYKCTFFKKKNKKNKKDKILRYLVVFFMHSVFFLKPVLVFFVVSGRKSHSLPFV